MIQGLNHTLTLLIFSFISLFVILQVCIRLQNEVFAIATHIYSLNYSKSQLKYD